MCWSDALYAQLSRQLPTELFMRHLTRIGWGFLFMATPNANSFGQAGIITTYAGPPALIEGAQASSQAIDQPASVAWDHAGGFYFASPVQNKVYRVTADGRIHTVAGNGSPGFSGDRGPATSAQLYYPTGIAVDAAGSLLIADNRNHRVRKVTPDGVISTVAGVGTAGFNGEGGPATSGHLKSPYGVAVDTTGNLFIADVADCRVRKATPDGVISTVAGVGCPREEPGVPKGEPSTRLSAGDGGPAIAAGLWFPHGVAVDMEGNLFIADTSDRRVCKVTLDGMITTVVGYSDLSGPYGVAVDSASNLLIADTGDTASER